MTFNPQPAFGPAEPIDAYSRLLDVVIASSPVSQADTLNALHDAITRYQLNGPMQRITTGERQLLNQLQILAVGELLTAGSSRSAAARDYHVPTKNRCLGCSDSDVLRRLADGPVPHAKDCPHGKQDDAPRDEFGFTLHAPSFGIPRAGDASREHQQAAQPDAASLSEHGAQTALRSSAVPVALAPANPSPADRASPSVQPNRAMPSQGHSGAPQSSKGEFRQRPSVGPSSQ